MPRIGYSIQPPIIAAGAKRIFQAGWAMGAFEYRQAEEIREAFQRYQVRYLFLGKSGAILLGFPDTTQDADVYLDKSLQNGRSATAALRDLGFELSGELTIQIEGCKDFV